MYWKRGGIGDGILEECWIKNTFNNFKRKSIGGIFQRGTTIFELIFHRGYLEELFIQIRFIVL
jgi:hypothetical protein